MINADKYKEKILFNHINQRSCILKFIICSFFISLSFISFSQQNKIDSLLTLLKTDKEDTTKITHLNDLASKLANSNYDTAIVLATQALRLAENISRNTNEGSDLWVAAQIGRGNSYRQIGWAYTYKGDYSLSLEKYLKGIEIVEVLKQKVSQTKMLEIKKMESSLFNNIGIVNTRQNDYPKALDYYFKALKIAEDLGDKSEIGKPLGNIGSIYRNQGDYPKALDYYFKALKIAEDLGNKSEIGKPLGNIGSVYLDQGDYPKALDYYFKALKIAEDLGDKSGMGRILGNIGIAYNNQGDYPKALDYYFKALKIAEDLGGKRSIGQHLGNIGNVYNDQGDYPKALDYYFKALKIAEDLGDKRSIGQYLGNIGNVYNNQGYYPKALDYYFKALKIAEKLGDKHDIALITGNIGTGYTSLLKYKEAETYLLKAIALCDSIGILYEKKEFEKSISDLYDSTNRYQLAYQHYKIYSQLNDSLFNMEKTKDITRKEMNYEFEKKEAAAKAETEKQMAVAAAIKKKELIKLASVVGGLFLLLAVLGAIIRSLKIARKQKSIIEKQKFIIEKKQKEILNSIHYAKRIQKAVITSSTYIKKYLDKDYFVLFKPKDIVSGDFYWAIQHHNKFYMITADSTGHGVPGAFMSLLNISLVNEAIVERSIKEPHEILNYVRGEIIRALNTQSAEERKDGMDAILCCYDFEKMELHFAAANNPLWLLRDGEMMEYKADKMPVGKYTEEIKSFTLQTIALQKGDIVYTITDGYADQFGGLDNKKLGRKTLRNKLFENSAKSMAEQKEILLKTFNDWKADQEQIDDVSVMGVKI